VVDGFIKMASESRAGKEAAAAAAWLETEFIPTGTAIILILVR
jgi:hypothetical protein